MSENEPVGRAARRSGTRFAWRMLNGMVCSLRCQDFLDRGEIAYAHLELMAMQQALAEVDEVELDEIGTRDRQLLRDRATDLAACIRRIYAKRNAG